MALIKLNSNSFSNWTTAIPDDSVTTAKIADDSIQSLKNRNLIINGAMQVAQRGTSSSVSDNSNEGYQTIDRWRLDFGNSAGGACTISQDTTVPSNQGFSFSYKVDVTTANASPGTTQQIYFSNRIEAQDIRNSGWDYTKSDGSAYITCSFWVMSDKAGVYCFYARDHDANGGTMYFVKEFTLVASTWQKVEIQIPSSSSLVFNNDTGAGLEVGCSLLAGSDRNNATNNTWNTADSSRATANQVNFFDSTSNNFYLTGVQLEVGDVATPFEHESFGQTLAKCQRYYTKSYDYEDSPGTNTETGVVYFRGSSADSITNRTVNVSFPVDMRTNPTCTVYSISGTSGAISDCAVSYSEVSAITGSSIGGTTGKRGLSRVTSGTSVNSMIALHFVADAEL